VRQCCAAWTWSDGATSLARHAILIVIDFVLKGFNFNTRYIVSLIRPVNLDCILTLLIIFVENGYLWPNGAQCDIEW